MPTRALVGLVLVPALVLAVLLAVTNREKIIDRFESPNDDPGVFCSSPDPSPVAETNAASLILQGCSAGKTYSLPRGGTIAIDLASGGRLDSGAEFHGLTISDRSILETVIAPKTIEASTGDGAQHALLDYFALYRGIRSGNATISALYRVCLNSTCNDTFRWEAFVRVS